MFEGSLVVCRELSPKDSDTNWRYCTFWTCFAELRIPLYSLTYCLLRFVPPFLVSKDLGEMGSNKMKKGESPHLLHQMPSYLTFSFIIDLSALPWQTTESHSVHRADSSFRQTKLAFAPSRERLQDSGWVKRWELTEVVWKNQLKVLSSFIGTLAYKQRFSLSNRWRCGAYFEFLVLGAEVTFLVDNLPETACAHDSIQKSSIIIFKNG